MDKITTYNMSEDFIDRLSGFIQKNYLSKGADLDRIAFVFEGRRPSLFLKKRLAGNIKKGFLPPRFFSIDEFIEYTLRKKMPFSRIPAMESCYAVYKIAEDIAPAILKGRESFSQFLPWAREIAKFIDSIDVEDIPSESLRGVEANASIGYEIPENINTSLKNIVAIREAYHRRLSEKNFFSRGYAYLLASRAVSGISFDEFDKIFFCGFFYMQKTERKITKHLMDTDKAHFFFQGSEDEWPVLKGAAREFSKPIRPAEKDPCAGKGEVRLYSAFDDHSEVCTVREILKRADKAASTVIVLPDSGNMIPLVSEIASLCSDFNVSLGYPLRRSSLYSLFVSVVQAQKTRKGKEYYAKDYIACLSHPLVKNLKILQNYSATRVLVHKTEEAILGKEDTSLGGRLFFKLKDIEDEPALFESVSKTLAGMDLDTRPSELKEVLKGLHAVLFRPWEDLTDFRGFAASLGTILDVLVDKSLMSEYGLNLKIAERMYAVRDELINAPFSRETFSAGDIFKIFRNMVENEVAPFVGSPLRGLQILGPFETRSLSFENVIVMDANESVLPRLRVKEPLIPHDVSLSLGLKIIENEEEIQRHQFKRLIASAKNVHLVFQENPEKEKSRFVEEIIWQFQKEKRSLEAVSIPQARFSVNVLQSKMKIKKTDEIIDLLKDLRYSASSVDTYVNCPLQFYYKYVLGLEEKEEFPGDPEGKEIGTFVHELLKDEFRQFIGKKPHIDGRFRERFFREFHRRFRETFGKRMRSDSFLLEDVMKFRLERFLQTELDFKKRPVKEILSLEEPRTAEIELSGDRFGFKYIVDRIDRLSDGSALIIDYKTGADTLKPQSAQKLGKMGLNRESVRDRIKSFQLPLYYYFEDKRSKGKYINAALYNLRNLKLTYLDEDGADAQNIVSICIKALDFILHEIIDPTEPFAADRENERACRYCPFFYLCR